MLTFLILSGIICVIIYWRLTSTYGFWKKRGLPFAKPVIYFGNLLPTFTFSKSLGRTYTDLYNESKGLRYYGIYKLQQPAILVRDPDILKDILIKDFSSFHDNDIESPNKEDIIAKNPFVLKGEMWKIIRTQLTPSFTSGKIKSIFPLIETVTNNMVSYLEKEPSATGKYGMDAKELTSKFATDVVATCAYGLEANSFTDPNAEFRRMGKKITTPSFWLGMRHMIMFLIPSLAGFLKISFVTPEVSDWFRNIVNQTVEYRMKKKISRNDFIDLMIQLKSKPGEYEFTNEDIASHCTSFFLDGFETSSATMAYTLYELAANPDVQTTLRAEIDRVIAKHDGKLSYETIHEMSYLDNVFLENLRKNPPGLALFKKCTQQYTLPHFKENGSGKMITVEPGTPIIIPLYGIHKDPKYYPDPERFDPDRFNEVNRQNRQKCTFLSFGEGPRACLGQRFAIAQSKMAIASIISNFVVTVNSKTITPLQEDPKYFMLAPKGGIWLNFYKRTDKKVI